MIDPQLAVFEFVRSVPPGKVVTYGQVAGSIEGIVLQARQVGGIMAVCPPDVPWQRVIGAQGVLPIIKRDPIMYRKQRDLLEKEGVKFLEDGRIDMNASQWNNMPAEPDLFSGDL